MRKWFAMVAGLVAGLRAWWHGARPTEIDQPGGRRVKPGETAPGFYLVRLHGNTIQYIAWTPTRVYPSAEAAERARNRAQNPSAWTLVEATDGSASVRAAPRMRYPR